MRRTTYLIAEHVNTDIARLIESFILPAGRLAPWCNADEYTDAGHWEETMRMVVNKPGFLMNPQPSLNGACRGDSPAMIAYLLTVIPNWLLDYDDAIRCAIGKHCEGYSCTDAILFMAGRYIDPNICMRYAASAGSIELCELIIARGAGNWNMLLAAGEIGNINIVSLGVKLGATNWKHGLCHAVLGGSWDIAMMMIGFGIDSVLLFLVACSLGSTGIVRQYLLTFGTPDVEILNRGLSRACEAGHGMLMDELLDFGALECSWCGRSGFWHDNGVVEDRYYHVDIRDTFDRITED